MSSKTVSCLTVLCPVLNCFPVWPGSPAVVVAAAALE